MSGEENFEGPEAPITITMKGGAGFEAPWIVYRASSAEDAVALLAEAEFAELPELVGKYAVSFREKAGAAPAQSAGGARESGSPSAVRSARTSTTGRQSAARGAAPQSRQQQSNDDVEYHPEGVTCPADGETVVYKEINSRGRKFELWVCPNQRTKLDGHFSEFVN